MIKKKRKNFDIRKGFVAVQDKKYKNWSKYWNKVWMLKMNIISKENAGYLRGYTLEGDGEIWKGMTQFELIDDLKKLKEKYDLKTYETVYDSDDYATRKIKYENKEILLIYVDEVLKVKGFLQEIITGNKEDEETDFENCIQVLGNIEFRSYTPWIEKSNVKDLQDIVDEFFIPEKYFYFTPNQRTKKTLYKAYKKSESTVVDDLFPQKFGGFKYLRRALFGGLCYCGLPGSTITKPVLHLDIKSAYIYTLLTKKFPMKKVDAMPTDQYEYYIDNDFETSLGMYTITYTAISSIITCFTDREGKHFTKGKNITVKCVLNSIDLKNLMNLPYLTIHEIKCTYLEAYELDYLPMYVVEKLKTEYIKKSKIDKKKDPVKYDLQKTILNGIYGNTIRTAKTEQEFRNLKKSTGLAPHWGVWTTSYTKEMLLGLAKQVHTWIYSDTDSIFCLDSEENIEKVEEYNAKILRSVEKMCVANNLDFKEMQELGQFEIDNPIIKFKALKQKEYLYTELQEDEDGEIKEVIQIKAAGCNKEEIKNLTEEEKESLYTKDILPVGTRVFPKTTKETTTTIIDGEEVTSKGSYYVKTVKSSYKNSAEADQARLAQFIDAYTY